MPGAEPTGVEEGVRHVGKRGDGSVSRPWTGLSERWYQPTRLWWEGEVRSGWLWDII